MYVCALYYCMLCMYVCMYVHAYCFWARKAVSQGSPGVLCNDPQEVVHLNTLDSSHYGSSSS